MSHTFEEIIKQKLASQTYTSNDADWIKFQQKKQTFEHSKNIKRWLVGSGIAAIVIGTVVMVAVHHNPVQEPVSNSNSIFYDTLTPTISVVADTLQEVTSTPAQSQNAATDIKVQHKKLSTASTAKPQVQEIAKTSSKKVPLASTHAAQPTSVNGKKQVRTNEDSLMLEILNSKNINHTIPINSAQPKALTPDSEKKSPANEAKNVSKKQKRRM